MIQINEKARMVCTGFDPVPSEYEGYKHVTRSGDLLDFGQLLNDFGNT